MWSPSVAISYHSAALYEDSNNNNNNNNNNNKFSYRIKQSISFAGIST
jgi:hypothetical protein